MKVVFDPARGKLYDFFLVINNFFNAERLLEMFKSRNVTYYKELEEAYRFIWDGIDKNTPGITSLITSDSVGENFFIKHFYLRIWEWKTSDVFIENFDLMFRSDLPYELLSYYDTQEHSKDYYQTIMNNPVRLHDFIYQLNVPMQVKLELIGILSGSELYPASLKKLFMTISERIDHIYNKYMGTIDKLTQNMKNHLESEEEFTLMNLPQFKEEHLKNSFELVKVGMSFLHPLHVIYWNVGNQVDAYLGAENNYHHYYEKGRINKYSLFFKALSDESRIRIIEILRDREMYIGEISKELDIPLTTLTYHLRMLQDAGIIITREEGKKTYCLFISTEFGGAVNALKGISGIVQ